MFPSQYRLKEGYLIKRVFQRGQKLKCPLFYLFALKKNTGTSRATVVVSKKINKSAVIRNSIKRRVRAASYHYLISLKDSYDIIILPSANCIKANFEQLRKQIEQSFIKLSNNNG